MRAALAGGQDRRGIRLNGNNLDVRVLVLEVLAGAGDGAAGADACNKNIDLAVGLLPDLRAGGRIVRGRVCRVDELTRDKAVRGLLRKLICLRDRTGHTLCALGQNQLRAVSLEHIAALDGHGLGHGEDDAVAASRRDSRQTDAGVAGGRLDDGSARLECAGSLSLVDHGVCDTVLDRAGRIEVFEFCKDGGVGADLLCEFFSRVQRSVADQISKALFNIRHGVIPPFKSSEIVNLLLDQRCSTEKSVSTSAHSREYHSFMPPFYISVFIGVFYELRIHLFPLFVNRDFRKNLGLSEKRSFSTV